MVSDEDVCYRHPGTAAAVACQRCSRPICSRCMITAPVGSHCPECTKKQGQRVYRPRDLQGNGLLVKGLMALSVIVFVGQMATGDGRATGGEVFRQGVLFGPWVAEGEFWRVISSGFLHLDPIHLAFNMYALYLFGPAIERSIGWATTLFIYLGGLLGGSAAVLMFNFATPSAGASGAVLGLAGGLLVLYKANGISLRQSSLGPVLAINLALPLLGTNISFWGHAGGIAGGAVLASILGRPSIRRDRVAARNARYLAAATLVGLAVVCVVVSRAGGVAQVL